MKFIVIAVNNVDD